MIIDLFSERNPQIIKDKIEQVKEMKDVILLVKKEVKEVDEADFNSLTFNWRIKQKSTISELNNRRTIEVTYINSFDKIYNTLPFELIPEDIDEFSFDFDPLEEEFNYLKEYTSYLGVRKLRTTKKTNDQIKGEVDTINQHWDCIASEKIQNWYYENNSEYREQINIARENENICFYEVITSDMDIEAIKKELSQTDYIHSGSFIPFLETIFIEESSSTYDESFETSYSLYKESIEFENNEQYFYDNHNSKKGHFFELSEDKEYEVREQYAEEGRLNAQYETEKQIYQNEHGGNYEDHLYIQRIKDDEE